jgi:hypothetical protein
MKNDFVRNLMQKKNESACDKAPLFKICSGLDLHGKATPGTQLLRDLEIIDPPQGASKARRMSGSPFWALNNDAKEPQPRNFLCWNCWNRLSNRTGSAFFREALVAPTKL